MSHTFSFDITVSTHEGLQSGITEGRRFCAEANHTRINVVADDDSQASYNWASLFALQTLLARGYYVTGCYVRL